MTSWKRLTLVVSIVIFSGCSPTRYVRSEHRWPNAYGYDEVALDSNLYRVIFTGNSSTPLELVDRYALYRSAELTTQKGYDYFQILTDRDNPVTRTSVAPVSMGADPSATVMPYGLYSSTEHSVVKTIRLYRGVLSDTLTNAFDAKTLLRNMQPSIDFDSVYYTN